MVAAARGCLAVVFVLAACLKAMEFDLEAANLAVRLGVSDPTAGFLLASLVTLELGLALLLVAHRHGGSISCPTYAATLLILAAFSAIVAAAAVRGTPDCGCFGSAIVMTPAASVAKNALLAAMAAGLFCDARRTTPLPSREPATRPLT